MRSPRVKSIEIESLILILFKVATLRWARGKSGETPREANAQGNAHQDRQEAEGKKIGK